MILGNIVKLCCLITCKLKVMRGSSKGIFNPKRARGGRILDIFCYISAGCYFFTLKLHDFFPSSLALDLRPFKKKNRT